MWTPERIETRQDTPRFAPYSSLQTTALLINNHLVSDAIEYVDWGTDPICLDGYSLGEEVHGWLSIRQAGDYVLLLPPVAAWREDDWYYDSPKFLQGGAAVLNDAQYARLRKLVAQADPQRPDWALPRAQELKPLTRWESVQVLYWQAPWEALDGDRDWEPMWFRRESVLATDHRSDDEAIRALGMLLETGPTSEEPVALRPLNDRDVKVSFFLDHHRRGYRDVSFGFTEWQPLAIVEGEARLFLEPGYVLASGQSTMSAG